MIIQLSNDDLAWCKELAMKRSGAFNFADTKNSRTMMPNKPNWTRHYYGLIGELAYSKITGEAVNELVGTGDDGTDFANGVQIKTSNQPKKPNLMILVSLYERKHADIYILMWARAMPDGAEVECLGGIRNENMKKVWCITDKGFGPTYKVPYYFLKPIEKLLDIDKER